MFRSPKWGLKSNICPQLDDLAQGMPRAGLCHLPGLPPGWEAAAEPSGQGKGGTYQGPTAEEDHEDDEGLEPVVLHDAEAGFPEVPPNLPLLAGDVHVEAGESLHAAWGGTGLGVTPGQAVPTSPSFVGILNPPWLRLDQDPPWASSLWWHRRIWSWG